MKYDERECIRECISEFENDVWKKAVWSKITNWILQWKSHSNLIIKMIDHESALQFVAQGTMNSRLWKWSIVY